MRNVIQANKAVKIPSSQSENLSNSSQKLFSHHTHESQILTILDILFSFLDFRKKHRFVIQYLSLELCFSGTKALMSRVNIHCLASWLHCQAQVINFLSRSLMPFSSFISFSLRRFSSSSFLLKNRNKLS